MDLKLNTIAQSERDVVVNYDIETILQDALDSAKFTEQYIALSSELTSGLTALENLQIIQNHLAKYGSSEALIDLVGEQYSTEGAVLNGIQSAIRFIIEKIKQLLAWIAKKLNRLAGVKERVVTLEKVVEKIKEVPVEVIREKEVVRTVKEVVDRPVYVEKETKFKLRMDLLGWCDKLRTIVGKLERFAYDGEPGAPSAALKEFVKQYELTPHTTGKFDETFLWPFEKKETVLTTSQVLKAVQSLNKIAHVATRGAWQTKDNVNSIYKDLQVFQNKSIGDEKYQKRIADITADYKEALPFWNSMFFLFYHLLDYITGELAYIEKSMFGESQIYTDKK